MTACRIDVAGRTGATVRMVAALLVETGELPEAPPPLIRHRRTGGSSSGTVVESRGHPPDGLGASDGGATRPAIPLGGTTPRERLLR